MKLQQQKSWTLRSRTTHSSAGCASPCANDWVQAPRKGETPAYQTWPTIRVPHDSPVSTQGAYRKQHARQLEASFRPYYQKEYRRDVGTCPENRLRLPAVCYGCHTHVALSPHSPLVARQCTYNVFFEERIVGGGGATCVEADTVISALSGYQRTVGGHGNVYVGAQMDTPSSLAGRRVKGWRDSLTIASLIIYPTVRSIGL